MQIYTSEDIKGRGEQRHRNEVDMLQEVWKMYEEAPSMTIGFERLRKVAVGRVNLLRKVEQGMENSRGETLSNNIYNDMRKLQLEVNPLDGGVSFKLENNNISHYVVKLAFCGEEDKRQYLVKTEGAVFGCIVKRCLQQHQQVELLKMFGISSQNIDQSEWSASLRENILAGSLRWDTNASVNLRREDFIKMGFRDCVDLVGKMNVFVSRGVAYVPKTCIPDQVVRCFKERLKAQLEMFTNHRTQALALDIRIKQFLDHLPNQYFGKDYASTKEVGDKSKINLNDLKVYSQQSFPPCMRHMIDQLQKDHHLKHFGRLTLGLFLKGAGLSLADQSTFMKAEFTKKMTLEEYKKKNYQYNINHLYGQEGQKTNYTPQSCGYIIKQNVSEGEHHGCPFASQNPSSLTALLKRMGLPQDSPHLQTILTKQKHKQFQAACRQLFTALHSSSDSDQIGHHPNAYFDQSKAIRFPTKTTNQKTVEVPMQEEI